LWTLVPVLRRLRHLWDLTPYSSMTAIKAVVENWSGQIMGDYHVSLIVTVTCDDKLNRTTPIPAWIARTDHFATSGPSANPTFGYFGPNCLR